MNFHSHNSLSSALLFHHVIKTAAETLRNHYEIFPYTHVNKRNDCYKIQTPPFSVKNVSVTQPRCVFVFL